MVTPFMGRRFTVVGVGFLRHDDIDADDYAGASGSQCCCFFIMTSSSLTFNQ